MTKFLTFSFMCLIQISSFAKELNIQHWHTKNGTKVLFVRANDIPMVDINIAFKAGAAYDGKNWGLAILTANLLEQGANGFNATKIAEQFENYGALYSNDVELDKSTFSLRSLSDKDSLNNTVKTLSLLLSKPDFKDNIIIRKKKQQLATIKYMNEKPSSVASNAFYKALYHNKPYGHPLWGNAKTVNNIDKKQITTFFKKHYTAQNAVLSIVGDLSTHNAKIIAEKLTSNLGSGAEIKRSITSIKTKAVITKQQNIDFPSNQTTILIGQIGIAQHNPLYFPLMVGNYTLGGSGLLSRLAEEIREKRGLTYGAYSSFKTLAQPGPFTISLATKASQTKLALEVAFKTLNQFLKDGPSQIELDQAKQYLTGSFPLKLSSNKSIGATLLNIAFYQLPLDYINTYLANIKDVKIDQIKSAFNKVINKDKLITIIVGQQIGNNNEQS